MPGKRAAGVKARAVPVHEDLWQAALAKAKSEDRALSAVIREFLEEYVTDDSPAMKER